MVEKFRGRITSLVPTPHIAFGNSRGGGNLKPCHTLMYTNTMFGCFLFLVEHEADRGSVWQPSNGADLSRGTAEDGETFEH